MTETCPFAHQLNRAGNIARGQKSFSLESCKLFHGASVACCHPFFEPVNSLFLFEAMFTGQMQAAKGRYCASMTELGRLSQPAQCL